MQTLNFWVRTFLVVQWLRIRLPTQRTQVCSQVQEDSTCHRQLCAIILSPCIPEPVFHNKSGHRDEKPEHCN